MMEFIRLILFYCLALPMNLMVIPLVIIMAVLDRPKNYQEFKKNVKNMMDQGKD